MVFRMEKNLDRFFFRFVTMHAFDRQTDRQTDRLTDRRTDRYLIAGTRLHSMQRGKNTLVVYREQTVRRSFSVSFSTLTYFLVLTTHGYTISR